MMTKTQINKLIKMMNDLDYPFEAPLKESFIESIIQINLILIQLIAWRSYVMKLVFFLRINLIILLF
ncbi:hypothetical protein ECZC16_11480 [Escherichia coli]|nr:hypothetical protein ECZC08_12600 [Escherichia coli]GJI20330.1 hypothetical protein ECZC16_11480 [Escherichia coli]